MNKKRIEWIDLCKGIGIILVLLGHTQASPNLNRYIFSFHMPLFFFISGYLFDIEKYPDFISVVKAKAKSILIPYVSFSVLSVILFSVISDYHINNWYSIFGAFLESKRNQIFYNVPLWFFTTLFLIEILYFIIKKYLKNKWLILTLLIILSGIEAIKYNTTGQPKLPWSFDLGIYYLLFYGVGNIVKSCCFENKYFIKQILICACFIINICLLISPEAFNEINMIASSNSIVAYLFGVTIAFAGIVVCICLSKHIKSCRSLSYLGKNTMIIFPLHFVLCYNLINTFVLTYKIQIAASNITGFIYVAIEILILIPVIKIINNYFPWMLGKKKMID